MYRDNYTSEHVYSVYEVTQIIGKTPAQVLRLIKKGYLQANQISSGNYVITDKQLGDYYLFGQYGRRPSKGYRKKISNLARQHPRSMPN